MMTGMKGRAARRLAGAAALTCCMLSGGAFSACARSDAAGHNRLYVTSTASTLVDQGIAAAAPTGADAGTFQEVPQPGLRFRIDDARATRAPWIDSNAWRFQRGVEKANYVKLPKGTAPLAAAEAFMFNVEAILNPDPADVEELGKMLRFLKALDQPPLPALANIEIVDDKSPMMGEVLNLLTRRNLLYQVVSAPQGKLDVTVQLGTAEFPPDAAANPSDFAARVRAKLGDDKRLVRLYGTSTIVARLTGDGARARLYLLEYGGTRDRQMQGGDQQGVRVRVLRRYTPTKLSAYGAPPDAKLGDVENPGDATEFWVPVFNTVAIIDLDALK